MSLAHTRRLDQLPAMSDVVMIDSSKEASSGLPIQALLPQLLALMRPQWSPNRLEFHIALHVSLPREFFRALTSALACIFGDQGLHHWGI